VQIAGKRPAHDAETDDPDNAFLFLRHAASLLCDFKVM
jgi:hypothetical protein